MKYPSIAITQNILEQAKKSYREGKYAKAASELALAGFTVGTLVPMQHSAIAPSTFR